MKFLFLVSTLLLGVGSSCFGQHRISGVVLDRESNQPLSGANITIREMEKVVVSDPEGSFKYDNLPSGNYTLDISFVGFKTQIRKVNLTENVFIEISLEETAIMTDEVVVTATRADEKTPMTFSIVEKEDLEKQNFGQDIPFLLNQIPSSVSTSDAGAGIGYTYLRIRGSDATRVNVTINGIPLNDSESQGVFWVDLPDIASSVESIQVQRGVGTSTNGPGAFGATINILTSSIRKEPYAEINNSFGSYNTRKHTLAAGTGLLKDHFSMDARLSRLYSDGYVDRAFTDMNSYFTSLSYYGKSSMLKFNLLSGKEKTYQSWWGVPHARLENDQQGMMDHIINNGLNTEQADNLLNSGRTYNYYTYDDETDNYRQDHYQLLFAQDFSKTATFNAALFYTHGEGYFEQFRRDDDFSDYGLNNPIIGTDTITTTNLIRRRWLDNDLYGFNYSLEFDPSSKLNMILGGGWSNYSGQHFGEIIWSEFAAGTSIRERFYDNTGDKSDFNSYLKTSFDLNNRLSLFGDLQFRSVSYTVGGVDIDQRSLSVDETHNFINPKVGITYSAAPGQDLYLSYSVANREPVRDDYIDAPARRKPKPETLFNWETGYRKSTGKSSLNANFYLMDYRNQLVLTGELNDVGASVRTNVKSSVRMGLEVQYGMQVNEKIRFDLNGAISRNKITAFEEVLYDYGLNWDEYNEVRNEFKDTDISFSPNIISGGTISYHPVRNLEFSWISKYVGKQYLDNTSNEDRIIEPYFVNDLRLSYTLQPEFLEQLGISLQINNIMGTKYESNGYSYGYMGGGVEIRENLYYPQADRNFLASVSLKF